MELEALSPKQLNHLELCVKELLIAMKKSRVQNELLLEPLKLFEHALGEIRRERFDTINSEFSSY